jgi:hypothetical protein
VLEGEKEKPLERCFSGEAGELRSQGEIALADG